MDLSVIIVNYNVRHFLEQCLYSVRRAAAGTECEIYVVDNNSADGSCSMVKSLFPEVILLRNHSNAGFSAANNQAIRLSKGRYVLLLNPDTLVEENTFRKCISFMDDHPDAGAVGVKMINGNGRLLPESKRGFPTPSAAFFKMTGLARLFPRSGYFNRYYMGNLDYSKTAEADVIAGAFMFIRKEALERTGLLDESYFMYGEDIDLSYRLIKAGYKNYYFPGVKIIHYKGESTKKSDINYIIHFYRAMLIFISKHFNGRGYKSLRMILRSAILFSGFAALLRNLARRYFLPIADALTISLILVILIPLWGEIKFGGGYHYPSVFSYLLIPAFSAAGVISIYLSGGYKNPSGIMNVARGVLIAVSAILIVYALLPQHLRFSRAVIVFGGLAALLLIPLLRIILAAAGLKMIENPFERKRRVLVVSNDEGYRGIADLISKTGIKADVAGRVSIRSDDLAGEVLGNIDQLSEIIRVNRIREVIFSTRELSASQIIDLMQEVSERNVIIKIAPAGEKLIIGSNSLNLHMEAHSPLK